MNSINKKEVFDYDYEEVGRIVDKSPDNCRQIVRRAKQHLASQRPRFEVSPQRREQITEQFLQACNLGDLQGLIAYHSASGSSPNSRRRTANRSAR